MSDMLANMQNILGYSGLVGQNPYLTYQGQIPMAGYVTQSPFTGPVVMGPQDVLPTDAMGNPIQPPYGTTLNRTSINAPAPAPQGPTFSPVNAPNYSQNQAANAAATSQVPGPTGTFGPAYTGIGGAAVTDSLMNRPTGPGFTVLNGQIIPGSQDPGNVPAAAQAAMGGNTSAWQQVIAQQRAQANQAAAAAAGRSQGAGTSQASAAAPQTGLTRNQYLYLLANPGPPQQPGAAPPGPGQTPTGSPSQPSVIQSFLAAHPGGGSTGAGGYTNKPFFNTLQQLQGGVG